MRQVLHFLKAIGLLSLIFLVSNQTFAQTATPPATGDGSESNPYEIATLENLYWLSQSDTAWDKHYIQTADIDAAPTTGWDNDSGFTPIGNSQTKFTGTYNGTGHTINGLYINRPNKSKVGFFGNTEGSLSIIDSLGLLEVNISGNNSTGALIGENQGTSVNQCFSTGKLYGKKYVGGLIGTNEDIIKNCFTDVEVYGQDYKGGFVGKNNETIKNSYSYGSVNGDGMNIGGFAGANWREISNCFWNKESSGQNSSSGGIGLTTNEMQNVVTYFEASWDMNNIWGKNSTDHKAFPFLRWQDYESNIPLTLGKTIVKHIDTTSATIKSFIYKTGSTNVKDHGVCWNSSGNPTYNNSDTTNEGSMSDIGSFTSKINELKPTSKYYIRIYAKNNDTLLYGKEKAIFTTPPYTIPEGNGTEIDPYQITSLKDLTWLMVSDTIWDKNHIQTENINATPSRQWYNGSGFIPIGNRETNFSGTYNGQGHTINSLYIDRPSESRIGMFGRTYKSGTHIESLGLVDIDITGKDSVGALIGYAEDITINECFAKGKIKGNGKVGGLLGSSDYGTIKNCYSKVKVEGKEYVGGFVGDSYSTIKNSYSYGFVKGEDEYNDGGFAGFDWGSINSCFWNTESSGQSDSDGGTGVTTKEMKNDTTFKNAGWDFACNVSDGINDVWVIDTFKNSKYPFLAWQAPYAGHLDTIKGSCSVSISEKPFLTSKCGNKTVTATTLDSLTYNKLGTYTITWEFVQDNGNTITRKQMVKIEDKEKPTISDIKDQTIEMQDNASTYSVSGNELDPDITDNCQIDSITNDFNNKETLDGAEFQSGTTTIKWTAVDKGGNSTSRSFDIHVSNSTIINTIQNNDISIYPNPVNERLYYSTYENPIEELTMTDITGKTVIEKAHLQQKGEIDISTLNKGVYIIHLKTDNGLVSTKIIKE